MKFNNLILDDFNPILSTVDHTTLELVRANIIEVSSKIVSFAYLGTPTFRTARNEIPSIFQHEAF